MNSCVLILGSYVNAYSVVRELYFHKIKNIFIADKKKNLVFYSRLVNKKFIIKNLEESLLELIGSLEKKYDNIVIYPTSDNHLLSLNKLDNKISSKTHYYFNRDNIVNCLKKDYQYKICSLYNIPYPKTITIDKSNNELPEDIKFPIIIKPVSFEQKSTGTKRNYIANHKNEYLKIIISLKNYLEKNVKFIISEIIPGDDDQIYAYTAFRNQSGKILNEWIGKKESQRPVKYGVFSTASNQAPIEVLEQGRKLIEALNLFGICEPEFKYDSRDEKYKLMEVNLRSMMWHRVGFLSNISLHYDLYNDAIYKKHHPSVQCHEPLLFIYFKHELTNLLWTKGYHQKFFKIFLSNKRKYFAVFNLRDPLPSLIDWISTFKSQIWLLLKKLKIK